jgi:acyl-coenzyme A synthetase/AMP-(fatty) acid ligase
MRTNSLLRLLLVGKPHDVKGEAVIAFVVLSGKTGPKEIKLK